MKKYICLTIHTERLHDEKVWERIKKLLSFFQKFNIRASWFSVNPTFVGYRAMNFDEEKWKSRLKILAQNNQSIEQHTHFYKGKEGVPKGEGYDLSPNNVIERVREDKEWLLKQDIKPKGFISGAWQINEEILKILAKEGFKYDLSLNNFDLKQKVLIEKVGEILEIPATCTIKRLFLDLICLRFQRRFLRYKEVVLCPVHFHDFDLRNLLNYSILLFLIFIFSIFNFRFITLKEFYEKVRQL